MANVRDPAFWHRFSVAVHLDEEASTTSPSKPNSSKSPELRHSESWLARQHKKKRRNRCRLCLASLLFVMFIAAIVVTLVWLSRHGWFMHGEKLAW